MSTTLETKGRRWCFLSGLSCGFVGISGVRLRLWFLSVVFGGVWRGLWGMSLKSCWALQRIEAREGGAWGLVLSLLALVSERYGSVSPSSGEREVWFCVSYDTVSTCQLRLQCFLLTDSSFDLSLNPLTCYLLLESCLASNPSPTLKFVQFLNISQFSSLKSTFATEFFLIFSYVKVYLLMVVVL